ncbi:membrane protein DedA with SNARE-associated domain [Isoptericola sp. CG 20/1183]|uniref:Membrane protein DedA with SNARE-associated domain n=2 Tax=Promicromonosporaceae TaxID=85017 RepID=A0ABX5EGB9_9MICO|nr:membrane protein DedA with SNARE-associated domain [Isoptericola halotolerans]PRZ07295.1 membrane protein DedA with SNARE-associated domain [Isoptericola sp. CG 20/1183]
MMLSQVEAWILEIAASVWIYPAMFASAFIDGFFPPVPSESVLVTLVISAQATGVPWLWLIIPVAGAGAWLGDQVAYVLGRRYGTERLTGMRSARGRKTVAWARRALARRGAVFIIAARYIPVGRVAVNMTAGALAYPQRRFMTFSGVAAVLWAAYSTLIGIAAAEVLGHDPLLAMVVGVVGGGLLGLVVDRVVQAFTPREEVLEEMRNQVPVAVPDADEPSELA